MNRGVALGVVVALFLAPVPGLAGSVWLPGTSDSGNVGIRSMQERKFQQVVRQQYDFSCGSAAIATLLTFHYDDPTSESAAFKYMFDKGDQEKIKRVGFSLLDMKSYLESDGYDADGYKASLDTLARAGIPAIALINHRGYQHFIVVKGLQPGEVLVADPALGTRVIPRAEFDRMWTNGILFIVKNRSTAGQRHFNSRQDWTSLARAPLGEALSRDSLGSLSVSLPAIGEF